LTLPVLFESIAFPTGQNLQSEIAAVDPEFSV
jgi:hypothetical protein